MGGIYYFIEGETDERGNYKPVPEFACKMPTSAHNDIAETEYLRMMAFLKKTNAIDDQKISEALESRSASNRFSLMSDQLYSFSDKMSPNHPAYEATESALEALTKLSERDDLEWQD